MLLWINDIDISVENDKIPNLRYWCTPAHPVVIYFFLLDAKLLFQGVLGCNGNSDLPCKIVIWTHTVHVNTVIRDPVSPRTHRPKTVNDSINPYLNHLCLVNI